MSKIEDLREATYQEVKQMLSDYHKCAIIRPTGWGKTGLLTRLIRDYDKVLYLYPADVIKNTVLDFYYNYENRTYDKKIPNMISWTYQMLATADDDQMAELSNVTLIIADECHRLGGKRTSVALRRLLDKFCTKADLCGATATPERMDLVDEITEFFDNHVTSSYTLHDAFIDGIIKQPYYCYCSVNYKSDFEKIRRMANEEIEKLDSIEDKLIQRRKMNEHLKEISELVRMPNIIKSTCEECRTDTSYMKFIIFCSNIEHINQSFSEVRRWFKQAYPTHKIRTLIISSENEQTKKNVNDLNKLKRSNNTIDLIYSCDMLNMGYHINDLSGIVMYRTTNSSIIYSQQLGRTLSAGSNDRGIVFDVVDNIHRKSLYDVMGEPSEHTMEEQAVLSEYEAEIAKTQTDKLEYGLLNQSEIEEYLYLKDKYSQSDRKAYQGRYDGLAPSDLIVTRFSASYRELIEKTVAEPISMRCRQTYEYWVRSGGKTTGEYAGIKGVLLQEKAAREINYGYCNDKNSTHVPITPFAKIKKVSVECVLETIFGKNQVEEYRDVIEEVMSNKLPRVRENL